MERNRRHPRNKQKLETSPDPTTGAPESPDVDWVSLLEAAENDSQRSLWQQRVDRLDKQFRNTKPEEIGQTDPRELRASLAEFIRSRGFPKERSGR